MKKVLFVNQKGGCGKTLLADESAFYFERAGKNVVFYDLDGQRSAIHQSNKIDQADYAVIDTPGALQPEMSNWMDEADIVVIPTNCSGADMEPLKTMMEIAAAHDPNKFIIVFNRWNRFNDCAEFINWFLVAYPGYKTILMPESVALGGATIRKMSIFDFKPKHKAAAAMESFLNLLDDSLGD